MRRKHIDGHLRRKIKKYKLQKIFYYTDMFRSVLEFTDEDDRMNIYKVNRYFRKYIISSKFDPVYYKFNSDFFFDNLYNEKVLEVYEKYPLMFEKLLTVDFLKVFCCCEEPQMIRYMFEEPFNVYSCGEKTFNCQACVIYNFFRPAVPCCMWRPIRRYNWSAYVFNPDFDGDQMSRDIYNIYPKVEQKMPKQIKYINPEKKIIVRPKSFRRYKKLNR
ncbi:MAG: hypothetical protein Harvfovirus17_21 [Harvfovirus sp.]|uniref:Uncharacterized protein n=1 Tax=Harvfovirus sp. TaxID=2487768 RepID=A0A3G5A1N4_9VIRU|nr:MAG: hypothetical protein Harvfovirus17_21 [Harvfovirus sp.]